jgi:hypothetical protein
VFVSRKNLSRTVIEGGRSYYNSWQRRASHGIERETTREWLDQVAVDHDEADASAPPPRPRVYKDFHDKLAPAHRWLVAQVGRPWSKVYSELCARFDTRTVAGRHVVHDHMLRWVRRQNEPRTTYASYSRYDLVIDKHGILRKPMWSGRSWAKVRAEALAWAHGRRCASTYRGWRWVRYDRRRPVDAGAMTRGELRYLAKLPGDLRAQLVVPSPWPLR